MHATYAKSDLHIYSKHNIYMQHVCKLHAISARVLHTKCLQQNAHSNLSYPGTLGLKGARKLGNLEIHIKLFKFSDDFQLCS